MPHDHDALVRFVTLEQRRHARIVLHRCGIKIGADYDTLNSGTVSDLLEHARTDHYRVPSNANGSKGRYYHDMLQRRAQRD